MSILELKPANCKNCYKCIRNCPVKAIEVKDEQAVIIEHDCILCGNCVLSCPQNAKNVRCDIARIRELISSGKKVIASVAPSYISEFDGIGFEDFQSALKQLGFYSAGETAAGAYLVKSEYEKLLDGKRNILISSCCPTVVSLVQKHFPSLVNEVAAVLSPMQAHANFIREKNGDCYVVFIGPCFSKKDEAERYGGIDGVLTFEELRQMLEDKGISLDNRDKLPDDKYRSRFFPISGGIINSMKKNPDYRYIPVDGIDDCINVLKEIELGNLSNCFVEMSACRFGCVNGPAVRKHNIAAVDSIIKVTEYADTDKDFDIASEAGLSKRIKSDYINVVQPGESQIKEILRRMGKNGPEDELNCGTCGYATCRDKAVAVYYGKATETMCLPYMRQKAESFSNVIISETPNAIITVDSNLLIGQLNAAACRVFNIKNPEDVVKMPISTLMNSEDFENIFATHDKSTKQTVYLPEYDKYLEEILVYDDSSKVVIGIMKDVTDEVVKSEQIKKLKGEALEIADNVIENQMRVVQEIASLLGETTAETQVALSKLKNTMTLEDRIK